MGWWEKVYISYCSSSSAFLQGKTKSKLLHCFLRKAYGVGNRGEGGLGFFTHQTLLNLFLLAITLSLSPSSCLQQQELQKKSTAPESNNPQGTCFAFLEITVREKNYPRAAVWSTNTFSFPQQLGYCRNWKYIIFFLKLYLIPELMEKRNHGSESNCTEYIKR